MKGYTIGISVFGKDVDFDPEHDSLVRIHAGRLRRSIKLYYLEEGKHDPIIIEIPKGTYQPKFSLADHVREENNNSTFKKEFQKEFPVHEPSVAVLPFVNLEFSYPFPYRYRL